MSSETGQNLLLSRIRRLQEDLYSNEENDYQFTIPSEHEETWNKIENALEHYDQIMSADSNEAMETLNKLKESFVQWSSFGLQYFDNLKNYISQAEAKEQELAEFEEKVLTLKELYEDKNWIDFEMLLEELCQRGEKE